MKVAVGSMNPVKIAAVKAAVKHFWPDAEVVGVDVCHGTCVQPNSDDVAIDGAAKRAELSLKEADADFGFGLEGSTADTPHGMFMAGWIVVVDKSGKKGISGCPRVLLPERIAAEIRKGRELGPVMDEFVGRHNTKQNEGTSGILSNGVISRTDAFEKGAVFALARFLNPQYYE
ncbi:DUF84 family protein [Candidatus Woesearchaeota archaeon]|nr:DUF84 family protein [Candidatus Woesearchaeota archaeon]MBW3016061.1 DUF84 family protein [Candidatus Woesearchaeota archaeon]